MPFQQRLRLFPGGDAVHQQGIAYLHKLISKECMTRLLHLISKERNIWREVDTEKKEEKSVPGGDRTLARRFSLMLQ